MTDTSFANNPWADEFWNLTQQGAYIKKYGIEVAKTKARAAGTTLGAQRPVGIQRLATIPKSNFTVVVQRRNIGGNGGYGSSGDGAPS